MKRHTRISMIGILTGLFLMSMGTAFAQKEAGSNGATEGKRFDVYESGKGENSNAFMVEKIVGSKVRNMQEEELGTIEDLVVDLDTGRILYAVMDFGGFLGFGGKLFPVPWQSLAPLPSEGIFFLDVSKAKLEDAPAYDKDSLPEMGDMHWGTKIAAFYGASLEQQSYDYDSGIGLYPGIAQKDSFAKIFNPQSIKEISGEVIKVDQVIPNKGIISQVQIKLTVFVNRKEPVPVYMGPRWYVSGPGGRPPLKVGDKVTVTGSWITSQTEPFMIATTVTEGARTFLLRQSDGAPFWSGLKRTK